MSKGFKVQTGKTRKNFKKYEMILIDNKLMIKERLKQKIQLKTKLIRRYEK